jgi:hypothetical protein
MLSTDLVRIACTAMELMYTNMHKAKQDSVMGVAVIHV